MRGSFSVYEFPLVICEGDFKKTRCTVNKVSNETFILITHVITHKGANVKEVKCSQKRAAESRSAKHKPPSIHQQLHSRRLQRSGEV